MVMARHPYSVPARSTTYTATKSPFSVASRFGTTVAKKAKKRMTKGEDAADMDADSDTTKAKAKAAKVK
jgi:hypothetical protein